MILSLRIVCYEKATGGTTVRVLPVCG